MKTIKIVVSGLLIFSLAALSGFSSLEAQEKTIKRSSEDSLKCLELFSVYSLALQKKMHDYAIGSWRSMYENCPDISARIYSDGVDLMTHYIEKEEDAQRREALIDTLLMIFDQRIVWFGDHEKYPEGWILGRKGLEIVKYRRSDPEALQEAYRCFEKSYALLGNNAEAPVMLAWMQTTRSLFAEELIPAESVFENFIRINTLVTDQEAKEKDASKKAVYEKILSAVETIFTHTGISDCAFFTRYLDGLKDVSALTPGEIDRNIRLLEVTGCLDSEFYVALVEQDYKNAPDGGAAVRLAHLFLKREAFDDARKYYLEAIDKSNNDSLKAVYSYELGVLLHGHFGQMDAARGYARQSASLLPGWGAPYMLLGHIYARKASEVTGDEFEKQTVYWAAVDQFMKAQRVDTTFTAEAKKQIEVYSRYFPDQETCFFQGLEEGEPFVVGNWIGETTVVRYRK